MTNYTGDRLAINVAKFVNESFHIEGISLNRQNGAKQIDNLLQFLDGPLDVGTVELYARKATGFRHTSAILRSIPGMDVRVGNHFPLPGGPSILTMLDMLLDRAKGGTSPHRVHLDYEYLHPFIDGNGRSGRAIWAWQMFNFHNYRFERTFLHEFYYQTLDSKRG